MSEVTSIKQEFEASTFRLSKKVAAPRFEAKGRPIKLMASIKRFKAKTRVGEKTFLHNKKSSHRTTSDVHSPTSSFSENKISEKEILFKKLQRRGKID